MRLYEGNFLHLTAEQAACLRRAAIAAHIPLVQLIEERLFPRSPEDTSQLPLPYPPIDGETGETSATRGVYRAHDYRKTESRPGLS